MSVDSYQVASSEQSNIQTMRSSEEDSRLQTRAITAEKRQNKAANKVSSIKYFHINILPSETKTISFPVKTNGC